STSSTSSRASMPAMLSRASSRAGGTVARRMSSAVSDTSGRARVTSAGPRPRPGRRGWRTSRARAAIDDVLPAGIAVVLTRLFVRPTWIHGYPFSVGPDVPVYLWWARVADAEGVSLLGERPAVPVLIPTLASV